MSCTDRPTTDDMGLYLKGMALIDGTDITRVAFKYKCIEYAILVHGTDGDDNYEVINEAVHKKVEEIDNEEARTQTN